MTSSSSLYGSSQTTGATSSSNFTTLYSGGSGPAPQGNLVIPGTLTVNGCAILTNCNAFSLLPTNAESILFGGASTAMSIGSSTGVTTINNQLATANYTFPVADGVSGQVLVTDGAGTISFAAASTVGKTYSIDASATTGGANFNLVSSDPTTDTIKFAEGTNMSIVRTDANTITFTATNTTYTQNASATTGGANLNLVGSDSTTDTVKFASGTGITVTRTDADTITITNSDPGSAGVTSITGTTNQVIASSATGAVTLSTPQDIATTSTPTFAGANLGNVTVGVVTDNTIATTANDLIIGNSADTTNSVYINSAASEPVYSRRFTTATSANTRSLALNVQSSGTPTVGFGNALEFQVEAQPGNTERAGNISVISTDLTAGSEDFKFDVALMQDGAAAATRFSINSNGLINQYKNVSTTNTSTSSYEFNVNSTGTVAAGFGTAIGFNLEKADGNLGNSAYIDVVMTDDTIGSEDYRMGFGLMQNGASNAYKMLLASDGLLTTYGGIKILGSTSGSSQFTAPTTGSTLTYVLPGAAGAANTVLTNDGSGNLSWALPGGGGSTFGNVTVGVVTDNTISTTTGDLVLASATNVIDATTASINAGTLTVDSRSSIDTNTFTTSATTTVPLITSTRNVMKCVVYIVEGANVHTVEALVLRVDATTALLTTYGEMYNTSSLAAFTADVSGGSLRLLVTPASASSTTFSVVRTSLT